MRPGTGLRECNRRGGSICRFGGAFVAAFTIVLAATPSGSQAQAQNFPIEIVPSTKAGALGAPRLLPDGQFAVFATGDGAVLWNTDKGRLVRRYSGLQSMGSAATATDDGRFVAAGGYGGKFCVWEVSTGKTRTCFDPGIKRVSGVRFSRDGSRLIYAGDPPSAELKYIGGGKSRYIGLQPSIYVRNLDTGSIIWTYTKDPDANWHEVDKVDLSPDGNLIAAGTRGTGMLLMFDLNGRLVKSIKAHPGKDDRGDVHSLAFSPDGKLIATGGSDNTARIWEVASGRLVRTLSGHGGQLNIVQSVAWAPNVREIATLDSEKLHIWDLDTGIEKESRSYPKPGGGTLYLSSVIYSPRGDRLLLNATETVDRQSLKMAPETAASDAGALVINGIDTENDHVLIGTSRPRAVLRFDLASGKSERLAQEDAPAQYWSRLSSSRDGKRIIGTEWVDKRYRLLHADLGTDGRFRVLRDNVDDERGVAISSDGRMVAASENASLVLIDPASGAELSRIKGPKTYSSQDVARRMAFSSDNSVLAVFWTSSYTLQLFRTTPTLRPLGAPVKIKNVSAQLAFSPDGKFVLAPGTKYDDYTLELRSTPGLALVKSFELKGISSLVSAGIFSRDSASVYVSGFDALVRRWDINSGAVSKTFKGHAGPLNEFVLAAKGTRLVSQSYSDGIKVWDTATGDLLASHYLSSDGSWLTLTPEGFFDASSPAAAQRLGIVRGFQVSSIDQAFNALYRPDLVREKLAGDPAGKMKTAAAEINLDKVMDSGAAPKVAITSPAAGATAVAEELAVEASVADQGGGIGKVEWRVNGVTLGVEERGVRRTEQGSANSIKVSRTLGLTPGENRIAVLAYNEAGLIASEPAEIVVNSVQQGGTKPRLYVLAVGVNDYWDSALRLSYAASDAKKLGEGLKQAGSQLYEQVEVRTVLDGEATAARLDSVFAELSRKVRPQDVFVFFLAGHGKTVDARFYFLPQDFRYTGEDSIVTKGVGQNQLQEWVSRIKAQKSVLLFDACESGSLVGDRIAMRGIEEKTAIDRMTRAMGRTVLTATTDSKPAIEGYRGHGVFTYTLLAGFNGADANADGVVDVTELATYVDRQLPDLTYDAFKLRQVPQMSIVGSNFPLASKVALLPAVGGSAPPAAAGIPAKPTHFVIAPADFYEGSAGSGKKLGQLPTGTAVSLVRTEQGWVLVARDGKAMGYVAEDRLVRIQ